MEKTGSKIARLFEMANVLSLFILLTVWVYWSTSGQYRYNIVGSAVQLVHILGVLVICLFSFTIVVTGSVYNSLVSERKKAATIIYAASLLMLRVDENGVLKGLNNIARGKLLNSASLLGKKLSEIVPKDAADRANQLCERLRKGKNISMFELPMFDSKGDILYISWSSNTGSKGFEIIGVDLSERVESNQKLSTLYREVKISQAEIEKSCFALEEREYQLARSMERYKFVFEASGIGIWECDFSGKAQYASPQWYNLLEIAPQREVSLLEWRNRVHPEDMSLVNEAINNHLLAKNGSFKCEFRLNAADGSLRWLCATGAGLWNKEGKIVCLAGSHTDITEDKDRQASMKHLAYFDRLTGLPNRASLENYADLLFTNPHIRVGVFFLDIDKLKHINDSLGREYGDKLIHDVSNRVAEFVKDKGILSRVGGDEFCILLTGVKSNRDIEKYARELTRIFDEGFELAGAMFKLSIGIGIAVYPDDSECFEELLKCADIAMHKSKELSERYKFFNVNMKAELYENMLLLDELQRALDKNELLVHYQPIYSVKTGRVDCFEALIRWDNPNWGDILQPGKFISIAEESGLIIPIGRWVLKKACGFAVSLHEKGLTDIKISVNVSAVQIWQNDFVETVKAVLDETGLPYNNLVLEITESLLLDGTRGNLEKIRALKDLGVVIALDDFGTGYSALGYLNLYPISILKIEKSFVIGNTENKDGWEIVNTIIGLAHNLGLHVIAEGVETKEQLYELRNLGCDWVQGFYMARPMDTVKIDERLVNGGFDKSIF